MSTSPQVKPDVKLERARSFARRLMSSTAPIALLAPMERRLLEIARTLFGECVMTARLSRMKPDSHDLTPVSEELIAEAARLCLAAAVELESHLRQIRERIEGASDATRDE